MTGGVRRGCGGRGGRADRGAVRTAPFVRRRAAAPALRGAPLRPSSACRSAPRPRSCPRRDSNRRRADRSSPKRSPSPLRRGPRAIPGNGSPEPVETTLSFLRVRGMFEERHGLIKPNFSTTIIKSLSSIKTIPLSRAISTFFGPGLNPQSRHSVF